MSKQSESKPKAKDKRARPAGGRPGAPRKRANSRVPSTPHFGSGLSPKITRTSAQVNGLLRQALDNARMVSHPQPIARASLGAGTCPVLLAASPDAVHRSLVLYLLDKVQVADWHGVSDAANDLRVYEAGLK